MSDSDTAKQQPIEATPGIDSTTFATRDADRDTSDAISKTKVQIMLLKLLIEGEPAFQTETATFKSCSQGWTAKTIPLTSSPSQSHGGIKSWLRD